MDANEAGHLARPRRGWWNHLSNPARASTISSAMSPSQWPAGWLRHYFPWYLTTRFRLTASRFGTATILRVRSVMRSIGDFAGMGWSCF